MATTDTYTRTARWLHWTIAILIIFMLAGGFLMGEIPNSNLGLKITAYNWHKTTGLLILVLSLGRLLWRLGHKPPALPDGMKAWERFVASATHFLFYAFMIIMPLVGWAIVSTSSLPSKLFNMFTLPKLPFWSGMAKEPLHDLEELFEETHEILAFLAIALIILHIGAALKHHYKNKNDVLTRMVPRLQVRGKDL